jgi:hypothetical protein
VWPCDLRSMEHVRLIITADEVIYPQLSHNALATHFSMHLAEALKEAAELAAQINAHQDDDTASEGLFDAIRGSEMA